MKRWWYAAGLLAALFASSARGAEPYLEFLQALQKAGQDLSFDFHAASIP